MNRARSLALLVLLAGLTACVEQPTERPATPTTPAPSPVRLALLQPSAESNAAASGGVLTVDGPCLYAVAPNGRRMLLAFTTFDTRWEAGLLRVGRKTFAPGRTVALGGSQYVGPLNVLPWIARPAPGCDTTHMWLTGSID